MKWISCNLPFNLACIVVLDLELDYYTHNSNPLILCAECEPFFPNFLSYRFPKMSTIRVAVTIHINNFIDLKHSIHNSSTKVTLHVIYYPSTT